LDIAFKIPHFRTPSWTLFDRLIDFAFGIDIMISFRTTFQNPYTGDEVYEPALIAKNYILGRFWIDLFSTIPFEVLVHLLPGDISASENYKIVSCLKLIRILRLGKLINYLNTSDDYKMILKLIKLCFLLTLYIHIYGCMWIFFCKISGEQWNPNQYPVYRQSYKSEKTFYQITWYE
jgi:hypothetical protein